MTDEMNPEDFLSIAQGAKVLGISLVTMHRIIARGELTKYRMATDRRRVLLSRREVESLKTPKMEDRDIADAVSAIA
jgi:excisionase family DNA binding protein